MFSPPPHSPSFPTAGLPDTFTSSLPSNLSEWLYKYAPSTRKKRWKSSPSSSGKQQSSVVPCEDDDDDNDDLDPSHIDTADWQ